MDHTGPSPSCPPPKHIQDRQLRHAPANARVPRKTEGADPGEAPEPAPCGATSFHTFKFWERSPPPRAMPSVWVDRVLGQAKQPAPQLEGTSLQRPPLPRLTPSRWQPWCPRSCRRRRRGRCPRCPLRIRRRTGWGWGCRRRRARGTACRRSGRRATCSARERCG